MTTNERDFFLSSVRARLARARLALVWSQRKFLVSHDANDYEVMCEAQAERIAAIRAMMQVQALVVA